MPDWDGAIRSRLKTLHLDGAREAEIVEELAEHLDDRLRELLASGIDEPSAHRLALEELESHELITARRRRGPVAPAIGVRGGTNFMEGIWHDLKVSLRMIRLKPAFSAAVIGMLALGVAGNAAIFSVFNGLFLRPLPFAQSERLVDIDETAPKWNLEYTGVAVQDFLQWQKDNTTFDGMAFFTGGGTNLITPDGVAQRVTTYRVTHNLLDVLGLKPFAGRNFLPEEDRPNGGRVVMLGYDMWQRLFNGDRAVIGKTLKFDDNPYTIVGILPREAVIPDAEAWAPLQPDPTQGSGWFLSGVGRLKPGVTVWQAANDLTRVHRGMISGRQVNSITTPVVVFLRDRYFGDLKRVTRMLLGGVGVVLLIACVNIAGLMLVRGESRAREIAIRTAVGASRGRVIRQLLTESLVLAGAGGILGVVLGKVFLNGLLAVISDNVPKWVRFDLDWRFALFCIAATGAAAIVFGIAPALQAASVESAGCLQAATRSTLTRGKRGVLSVLVTGEIALALILLISSGLLVQAFRKVLAMDPGFRAEGVLTFSLRTPGTRYGKPEQRLAFFNDAIARLKSVPGVSSASAASIIPLNGHNGNFYQVENGRTIGGDQAPVTLSITALPGYFETMGMTLLGGRGFEASDNQPNAPRVTVVNESFARYFWGTPDVVGRRMRFNGDTSPWMQVAGVIRDTRHYGLDGVMRPSVFLPYSSGPRGALTFALRSPGDPHSLVSPAREILRQIDSELPMYDVRTMSERMDRSLWMRRTYSWLFAAFAGVAIVLAAAGIYGVISFAVSQRTREIGIRMALGARPGQVMSGVLRNGMVLVAIGVAIGVSASLLTARLLDTLLFGVSPRDVATYAAVVLGVAAVGFLANYVPARRASRVDPMSALRAE